MDEKGDGPTLPNALEGGRQLGRQRLVGAKMPLQPLEVAVLALDPDGAGVKVRVLRLQMRKRMQGLRSECATPAPPSHINPNAEAQISGVEHVWPQHAHVHGRQRLAGLCLGRRPAALVLRGRPQIAHQAATGCRSIPRKGEKGRRGEGER